MTIPTELAGQAVLAWAMVDPGSNTGHPSTTRYFDESGFPQIRFLAIATDNTDVIPGETDFYLFHCDEDWNVIWDSGEGSVAAAVAQARWEYGEYLRFAWLDGRPLNVRTRAHWYKRAHRFGWWRVRL